MDAAIPFLPFRRHHPFTIYQSNRIPHWRQDGCTYFVTFRLADSLPSEVLARIEKERNSWLLERGKTFEQLTEPQRHEYLRHFSRVLEDSLDEGRGECLLRDPMLRSKVQSALQHFDGTRLRLGGFVIMPNHVHSLITPVDGEDLESLLKSIKGFSARQMNGAMEGSGQVWQRDNYDHLVRDGDQLRLFQRYIANNPTKSGLPVDVFTHGAAAYSA